ncbi:double zinc ribbon domain-containing protein [Homoserinibacter sp. YIM 151385]|uniref:double zinc ribbon domain-containing protein n=1 Tax=Homoserinibacter sp. YIM 151385 TaxID=2985506 RepID=UPI0022F00DEE|nr:zinc ribbon domain-containing protein [Homoserinibacter sp. YIM 151385]WBU38312.1 zinc ribbon domain-containing protein [Homoserinibacter sp. YIM 151385]
MNCRHCGTGLPRGAMFCAECGQAVGFTAAPSGRTCTRCATPLGRHDLFCGSCGALVERPVEPTAAIGSPPGGDTVRVDPLELQEQRRAAQEKAAHGEPEPEPAVAVEVAPESEAVPEPAPEAARAPVPEPEREPEPEPELKSETSVEAAPHSAAPASSAPASSPFAPRATVEPAIDAAVAAGAPADHEDVEQTRLVARGPQPVRFVLQFSTGESVTVSGSGLIGRNPAAEPGEYVDQTIAVLDAGKSVSKTHLEFGQQDGRFWVADRFSTNGSVLRAPEATPRRCEPGRRYLVSRGTRVDIGEQFFVVS